METTHGEAGRARAASTFDEFGRGLFSLASMLAENVDASHELVIRSIREHKPGPVSRRDLSAGLYRVWVIRDGRSDGETHTLPADHRAALGLCRFGDHTYREAAAILGLAPDRVARLLREALLALAAPPGLESQPAPA